MFAYVFCNNTRHFKLYPFVNYLCFFLVPISSEKSNSLRMLAIKEAFFTLFTEESDKSVEFTLNQVVKLLSYEINHISTLLFISIFWRNEYR